MRLRFGITGGQITGETLAQSVIVATNDSKILISDGVSSFVDSGISQYIVQYSARPAASDGNNFAIIAQDINNSYAPGLLYGSSISNLQFISTPATVSIRDILYSSGRWIISGNNGYAGVWSSGDLISWQAADYNSDLIESTIVNAGNRIYSILNKNDGPSYYSSTTNGGSTWTASSSMSVYGVGTDQYGGARFATSSDGWIVAPHLDTLVFQFKTTAFNSTVGASATLTGGTPSSYLYFTQSNSYYGYSYDNKIWKRSTANLMRQVTYSTPEDLYLPFNMYEIPRQYSPGGRAYALSNSSPKQVWTTIDGENWTLVDTLSASINYAGVFQTGIPHAPVPGIISYANASQGSGTFLSWDPPSSSGGSPILGYRIYFQEDGASTWTNISSSSPNFISSGVTSVILEGTDAIIDGNPVATTVLQNDIFYYFRISAYNAIGEGPPFKFTGDVPSTVGQT